MANNRDYERLSDEELFALADRFYNGKDGFPQDYAEAARAVKTAADRGNAGALCDYGTYLMNGDGVEKDEAAALACWEQAAEKGFAQAQYKLGLCHLSGLCGLSKNEAKGAEYLIKAAEAGDVNAMFNLVILYDNGIGVPKDPGKALEYLTMSADLEFPVACFYLGMKTMTNPQSSDEEAAKAAVLLEKAASKGYADAQFMCGVCYENGRGVEKNLAEAAGWYRRAAKAGVEQANQALMRLGFPGVL